jgi:3',5'-cyclic AMP phosphodiesterase CpdA
VGAGRLTVLLLVFGLLQDSTAGLAANVDPTPAAMADVWIIRIGRVDEQQRYVRSDISWPSLRQVGTGYALEISLAGEPWRAVELANPQSSSQEISLPMRQVVQLRAGVIGPGGVVTDWAVSELLWVRPLNDEWAVIEGPPTQTIVVAGDIAGCAWRGDESTARLVELIPGIVMTAGDNVYQTGTLRQFRRCYHPSWGRFRNRTRPVPGNHDVVTPGAAGYFQYFGWRAGPRRRGWYAFDAGAWRVYALNTNCRTIGGCKEGSAELHWLRADLAAHPRRCVLAVWHHPRYSSGLHGNRKASRAFLSALYEAGADIVVNGHDHIYERFAPARPNGTADPEHGIRQFIVGTGGAPLYRASRPFAPNSRRRISSRHGVLRLALEWDRYQWAFIPVRGGSSVRDRGASRCHEAPA